MAKGIEINGQLRGKRGGVVYYRQGGQQISRTRNFAPRNPQTFAQRVQRAFLANASKAAVGLKGIIDHSFEGVPYGAASVRYFESKAQQTLKVATPTTVQGNKICPLIPLDATGFPVAEYPISKGTLSPVAFNAEHNAGNGSIIGVRSYGTTETASIAQITVAEFCQLFGLTFGDQLTIVAISGRESDGAVGFEEILNDNVLENIVRINFAADSQNLPMFDAQGAINSAVLVAEKSNKTDIVKGLIDNGWVRLEIGDEDMSAVGMIASRYENGAWRRSSEKLRIATFLGNDAMSDKLTSGGWNFMQSIIWLLTGSDTAYEEYFLNKENNSGPSIG